MAFGRLEQPKEFSGSRPMGEINVTPLVDVMLVLVVIFILTAPLLASSIRLELPRAGAERPALGPAHVALSLDRAGQVFLGDEALSLERLGERLAVLAAQHPNLEVQLRADALVPYGKVAQVMGVARKSGLNRIAFVAQTQ
jgi:biopolymer transport protein TolR